MSNLKSRIEKLHSSSISDVSSEIVVTKQGAVLRRVLRGTNPDKIIRIVVRL